MIITGKKSITKKALIRLNRLVLGLIKLHLSDGLIFAFRFSLTLCRIPNKAAFVSDKDKLATLLAGGGLSLGLEFAASFSPELSGLLAFQDFRQEFARTGQCSRGWRTSETFVAFAGDSFDAKFGLGFGFGCVRYFNSKLHGKHRFPCLPGHPAARLGRFGNTLCTLACALG